jgi:hypothetical protein
MSGAVRPDGRGRTPILERPPDSYGAAGWFARIVARNAQWVRREGLTRLVEEHDLHPVRSGVRAVERARWRRRHAVHPGSAAVAVVTGMPRSGTNMLVRGLAVLPEVEVVNEGDRAGFRRYRLRPDADIRDLVVRSRHRVILFKPLLDAHRTPGLLDGFGRTTSARALWLYRDVDGYARSALRKFGPAAHRALGEIAAGRGDGRWQAQGLSADSIDLIRSIDWQTARPEDGAALLWYVRHRLFFELGLDGRDDARALSYDLVVRDPERVMRDVCAFLGVSWAGDASAHIDRRSAAPPPQLPVDPEIRRLCDDLAARLDACAMS